MWGLLTIFELYRARVMYLEAGSNNYVIIVVSKFMTYLHVSRVSLFPQLIKQSNKRWLSFTSHTLAMMHYTTYTKEKGKHKNQPCCNRRIGVIDYKKKGY